MRLIPLTIVFAMPLLAACETSMRIPAIGGGPFGTSERVAPSPTRRQEAAPVIELAPSARVDTAPLAPPDQPQVAPGSTPQIGQQTPSLNGADGSTPGSTSPQRSAALAPAREEETSAPTRNSVTGNWTAREAAGSGCRVTLSSSPKLDLYGASTAGCQSRDLQRVSAWELRGEEVFLYEPGGGVAARLKAQGRSMSGTLSKTGAPISLSK